MITIGCNKNLIDCLMKCKTYCNWKLRSDRSIYEKFDTVSRVIVNENARNKGVTRISAVADIVLPSQSNSVRGYRKCTKSFMLLRLKYSHSKKIKVPRNIIVDITHIVITATQLIDVRSLGSQRNLRRYITQHPVFLFESSSFRYISPRECKK